MIATSRCRGGALETLEEHESDRRPYRYSLEQFEWPRRMILSGTLHSGNCRAGQDPQLSRMLWGKKILHWTGSGREALEV